MLCDTVWDVWFWVFQGQMAKEKVACPEKFISPKKPPPPLALAGFLTESETGSDETGELQQVTEAFSFCHTYYLVKSLNKKMNPKLGQIRAVLVSRIFK